MSKPFEEALAHVNHMLRPKQHPTEIDITYISPLETIYRRNSGRASKSSSIFSAVPSHITDKTLHEHAENILYDRTSNPGFYEAKGSEKEGLEALLDLILSIPGLIPGINPVAEPKTPEQYYMEYTGDPRAEAQRKWDIQEKSRAMAPHFDFGPFSEFKTDDAGTSTLDGITIDTEAAFKHGGGLSDLDKTININGQPHRLAWVNPSEEQALKRMGGSGKEVRGRPAYFYDEGLFDAYPGYSEDTFMTGDISEGGAYDKAGGIASLAEAPPRDVPDRTRKVYEPKGFKDLVYPQAANFGSGRGRDLVNPDTGLKRWQTEGLADMRQSEQYKNMQEKLEEHFDSARRGDRVHTLSNIDILQQQATDILFSLATGSEADQEKYQSYIDTLEGKDQLLGGKLGVNAAAELLFDDVRNNYLESEIKSGIKSATDEKQLEADRRLANKEGVELAEIQGREDRDKVSLTRKEVTDVVRDNYVAPLTVLTNVGENIALPLGIASAFMTPFMPSSVATTESGRGIHISKDGHVTFVSPENPLDYAGQEDFGNIDESLKRYRKPVEVASVSETVEEEDSPLYKTLKEREEPKTRDQLDAAMRERVKPLYAGRNIFAT
jgi:hypothetical protein